jgi:hypothetical protein
MKPPALPNQEPAVAEIRDDQTLTAWLGPLIFVGLTLLVLGGFVGHWWGSGAVREVQLQAQIEIARAKTEGAQLTIASLQGDLLGVLRDTLGDEAVQRPIAQAIAELDRALAGLPADSGAPDAVGDPRLRPLVGQLRATRDNLLRIGQGRSTALAELSALERLARSSNSNRPELARDVTEQRSGLGAVYSELANDAVKAHDLPRARRLLAAAAHFDPRNHPRYEKQLQSFDPSSTLPRDNIESAGPTGGGPAQ